MSAIKEAFHDQIAAAGERARLQAAADKVVNTYFQRVTYDALFGEGSYSADFLTGQSPWEYQLEQAKIRQDARWESYGIGAEWDADEVTECNHFFPDTGMRVSYCNHCGQKATFMNGKWEAT
jgi:hypothetical protein